MREIRNEALKIFGLIIMIFSIAMKVEAILKLMKNDRKFGFFSRLSDFMTAYGNVLYRNQDIINLFMVK